MQPIHILLIEDSLGDVMLIKEAIEDGNIAHTLDIVNDGWEGVQFLERKGIYKDKKLPDLILLDINMPKLNGHDVLDRIKNNDEIKHIPVIMLTTSSAEKDILKAYQKHSNCYIVKPIEYNDFEHIIKSIETFWTSIAKLPHQLK